MRKYNLTSSFIRTLIQTINEVFEADLLAHNRKRETVDAKRMFSTILRDLGCTYKNIAHMLNYNHATVIYHVKSMRDLMSMEIDLRDKYKLIMDIIGKADYELFKKTPALRKEVLTLRKKNNLLSLKVEELQEAVKNLIVEPL